jgi:hypothetical protein
LLCHQQNNYNHTCSFSLTLFLSLFLSPNIIQTFTITPAAFCISSRRLFRRSLTAHQTAQKMPHEALCHMLLLCHHQQPPFTLVSQSLQKNLFVLQDAVQEKFDRASDRTEDATQDAKQQMNKQQGRASDDQSDLQGGIGSRVQFAGEGSGRGDTGGSSSGSEHEHGKGLGGAIAVRAYCWCGYAVALCSVVCFASFCCSRACSDNDFVV